jgi:hypothetical protein
MEIGEKLETSPLKCKISDRSQVSYSEVLYRGKTSLARNRIVRFVTRNVWREASMSLFGCWLFLKCRGATEVRRVRFSIGIACLVLPSLTFGIGAAENTLEYAWPSILAGAA